MLTSGELIVADLGEPVGRDAGFPRPVVVVTAQVVLAQGPNVVHVVPVTTTRRQFRSEVDLDPDAFPREHRLTGTASSLLQRPDRDGRSETVPVPRFTPVRTQ
jgi:mRNA-degrading endonuclease toxin of MazEF toxin-antitoxin module